MADSDERWILVVEDDSELRDRVLIPDLQRAGFNAMGAGNAAQAYRAMLTRDFSLFLIGTTLADEDGPTIARHLRTVTDAGIVMLTSRGRSKADRIRGLDNGADAYVTKPVDIDVLAATLRSLLRRLDRPKLAKCEAIPTGWRFDMGRWNLTSPSGKSVRLTQAERLIVGLLAASPGEAVHRDAMISRLTQDSHDFDPHRLEVLIHRLRRKVLSVASEHLPLNAVRGVGYVLLATARERLSGLPARTAA